MSQKKRKKRKKRCPNGAIIQLENGKYFGRAPLGYTGKRYVYQRVTGNTKAEVRSQIAQRLNLRITPELTFILDDSVAHGAHISKLLNSITFSEYFEENEEENGEE